jgi:eukaryotic-like serine/threonine-protein kinase
MITKSQVGVTIGFTLAALLGSQASGDGLRPAVSRSGDEVVSELESQQKPISDEYRKSLNSQGKMLGVSLQRTNVYDATGLTEPKAVLWTTRKLITIRSPYFYPARGGTVRYDWSTENDTSMLTVAGEELYFSASLGEGYWFIVDRKTGEAKKILRVKGVGGLSQPVVAGDLLYVGAADGSFRAFDRHTGEPKWQIGRKDYRLYHTAPAVVDGVVYFDGMEAINPNGGMHAVDALTGDSKWTFKVKGPGTVAVADGVLYFGAGDNNLHAVNAETGQEIWRFKASNYVRTPVIMNERVFFSDRSNNLYAVDLKSGKEIWRVAMKNKMATHLAAYRGLLYFGGRNDSLSAVDADTGKEKWRYSTTAPCIRPVVANGIIYSATPDKVIFAVDAETGQEKWRYKTKRPLSAPPIVGDGVIYFLDEEGFISALG